MNLYLTDIYYKKENLKPLNELICLRGNKATFSILIDNDNKACNVICDKTPGLNLYNYNTFRLNIKTNLNYTLKPVGYVKDNHNNKYPDIIYDNGYCEYDGDEMPHIICDIDIPTDFHLDTLDLEVELFNHIGLNDEEKINSKKLTLNIYNNIKTEHSLYIDFWQHTSNMARALNIKAYSEQHFEVIEKLFDKLVEVGQKSLTVVVSECPWRGWGCYLVRENPAILFEYNIIQVSKKDNKLKLDFTNFDRYIELGTKKGINGDITLYGLLGIWRMPLFNAVTADYPENILIRYLDEDDGSIKLLRSKEDILEYIKGIIEHCKELGIWEKVLIGSDEPSETKHFLENLSNLKALDKNIKLKLAIDRPNILTELGDTAYSIAHSFPCTVANYQKHSALKQKLWYVCNIPDRPNTQITNKLTESALIPLLNYKFNFDGFLRWAITCWTKEPLKNIKYNIGGIPAGDLFLLYPNQNGDLLESLRYRCFKEGLKLYEMLKMVRDTDLATADSLFAILTTNADYEISSELKINTSTQALNDFKAKLIQTLSGGNI